LLALCFLIFERVKLACSILKLRILYLFQKICNKRDVNNCYSSLYICTGD
jgi:hypothetical protein